MRKTGLFALGYLPLLLGGLLLALGGCSGEDPFKVGPPGGGGAGRVTFYTTDPNASGLKVTLDGQILGTITKYYDYFPEDCFETDGVVWAEKPAGIYSYSASDNRGASWSGTAKVLEGGCLLVGLSPASGGSGGGGGGGGGGTNLGRITFYTSRSGGGATSISLQGQYIGSLHNYFPSGAPDCRQASSLGVVYVEKPPGTYSFTAEDEDGYTWSGTSTVAAGGCRLVHLY